MWVGVTGSQEANSDHLYWALCGGCGGLGIVAAIEVRLYPVTTVWAGGLTYPITHATDVFVRYREWTASLPEAMTSSIAIVNVPDASDIPPQLRGTSVVIVQGCFCGPIDAGKVLTSHWTAADVCPFGEHLKGVRNPRIRGHAEDQRRFGRQHIALTIGGHVC